VLNDLYGAADFDVDMGFIPTLQVGIVRDHPTVIDIHPRPLHHLVKRPCWGDPAVGREDHRRASILHARSLAIVLLAGTIMAARYNAGICRQALPIVLALN
jgi:hypothetical protein